MASPPGFPRSLLEEPWSARLAYFQRYTVAHPRLMEAKEKLVTAVQNAEPNSLLFVFGPTGVGKTTLRLKTEQILTAALRAECLGNPKLVQVGLDLIFAKSILFYETGYSTYVLRQASRRSWRIGQKDPVRVGFLIYAKTAQETCLRLMGKKLLVSLAMEGKLDGGGLQAMNEDDDVLIAMARELVTRQGVGEEAAAVWRNLQIQHSDTSHAANSLALPAPESDPIKEMETDQAAHWIESASPAVQLSLF